MNGYPHSKHSDQKTGAEYCHGPEALPAAKKLYENEYDRPHANNTNDVPIEHVCYSLFYKGTFFSSGVRPLPGPPSFDFAQDKLERVRWNERIGIICSARKVQWHSYIIVGIKHSYD